MTPLGSTLDRSPEPPVEELATLTDAELRDVVLANEAARAAQAARDTALLAEAERRKLARKNNQRTTPIWLSAQTRQPNRALRRRVSDATLLVEDFPEVHSALANGHIHWDHVALILRTARKPRLRDRAVEAQHWFLTWARHEDWGRYQTFMEAWAETADPADPQDIDQQNWDRRGITWTNFDGKYMIQIDTTAAAFAQFETAARPLTSAMLAEDWAEARERCGPDATINDLRRTHGQRLHDAWVKLNRSGAGALDPGASFHLDIIQDQETFDAEVDHHFATVEAHLDNNATPKRPTLTADQAAERALTYRSETRTGHAISSPLALRAAIVGHIRFWRMNAKTSDFTATREQRLFTGLKRYGIMLRDRECQTPGCQTSVDYCEADHITPHSRGGPTIPSNGQGKCGPCHDYKSMLETLGYRPPEECHQKNDGALSE